jgi:hypothetical protein
MQTVVDDVSLEQWAHSKSPESKFRPYGNRISSETRLSNDGQFPAEQTLLHAPGMNMPSCDRAPPICTVIICATSLSASSYDGYWTVKLASKSVTGIATPSTLTSASASTGSVATKLNSCATHEKDIDAMQIAKLRRRVDEVTMREFVLSICILTSTSRQTRTASFATRTPHGCQAHRWIRTPRCC